MRRAATILVLGWLLVAVPWIQTAQAQTSGNGSATGTLPQPSANKDKPDEKSCIKASHGDEAGTATGTVSGTVSGATPAVKCESTVKIAPPVPKL